MAVNTNFYPLEVIDVRKETEDTVSFSVDIPDDLKEVFKYESGQYITFRKKMNGEEVRRSYSLSSSPNEDEWRVAVKHVPGGKFSTFANHQLAIGDQLEAMPPMGNFVLKHPSEKAKYVAFAAGSGITPVISLIKTILEEQKDATFLLIYGNRSADKIIFREELEDLKNVYMGRFALHYVLSKEHPGSDLFFGRITAEKCKSFSKYFFNIDEVNQFFICGPEEMIFSVRDYLLENGAEKNKVTFELFTSPDQKKGEQKVIQTDAPKILSKITVTLDSNTVDFELTSDGDSILDAALNGGADLPFACKGGVCCTCKAKLIEGEVRMDVNFGLEEDEIEAGYILTCQAHPLTDKVVVDFDQ